MHRHDIRGVLLQPPYKLVLVRDVDGLETSVAFVVAVVVDPGAGGGGCHGPDEIEGVGGGGETLVEVRAPAAEFGDGVAEGHVADCLGEGGEGEEEEREGEGWETHFGGGWWGKSGGWAGGG